MAAKLANKQAGEQPISIPNQGPCPEQSEYQKCMTKQATKAIAKQNAAIIELNTGAVIHRSRGAKCRDRSKSIAPIAVKNATVERMAAQVAAR